ncbi:MAG: penicillin-binding protein activator [Methylophilaceae bacterium]|jgi:outer membrane PBP1 activator LpoA protein
MTQRFIAFLILCCMLVPGANAADTGPATSSKLPSATKVFKSPEERYIAGLECLKKADTPCAQVALAGINPASPYAKILEAQIAAGGQDYDTVLRLLIPLQAEENLLPAALASLHATLALAYENQGNTLRAVEQRSQADAYLQMPETRAANQKQLIDSLIALPRNALLEIRGESADTAVQGWIDLALAIAHSGQPSTALAQWRQAYPDHQADEAALGKLSSSASTNAAAQTLTGKVALLLPIDTPAFAFAAEAVRSGFIAAQKAANSPAEVVIYTTYGRKDEIAAIYRQAVAEGAQYAVGPLTRGEVAGLLEPELISVPTIALNVLDEQSATPAKLVQFGLPVEEEAMQLAKIARAQGMQTAVIAAANTPLGKRMAQAFASEWTEQGGLVVLQVEFNEQSNLLGFKTQLASERADMIFLAANAEQARWIRPYMNQAIPTFALSHIYDGNPANPDNSVLNAIHFVDMPWLLNPDDPSYSAYRASSSELPPNAQRWFAVGVDAWNILSALAVKSAEKMQLRGLTGTIMLDGNHIQRELPLAQFRGDGVALE